MSKAQPVVGMPILYFPGGAAEPFAGTVASVGSGDGRVNIAFTDQNGIQQARQGVSLQSEPQPGGDYVVDNTGGDGSKAIQAHQKAQQKAGFGQPTEQEAPKGGQISQQLTSGPSGDFASAINDPRNVQKPGSGGPFDPANTAQAHMSQHQREQSNSVGNPTTGGVTPKLSEATMGQLPERDREAAQAILKAKSPEEQNRIAGSGTGAATRGTAQAIVDNAKKGPQPLKAGDVQPAKPNSGGNEEVDRISRNERLHDEAVEKSKTETAARKKDPMLAAGPGEQRKAAEKAMEEQRKAAAKKVPAKQAAAKKAAKVPAKKAAKKPAAKVPAKKSAKTRR